MRARLSLLVALALAGSTGCETFGPNQCDDSLAANQPVNYAGGTTEDGVYTSSAWTGPLLSFPGGQRYTLLHGLGTTPKLWAVYLSFDIAGTTNGSGLAQAAGNQAEVVGIDDKTIEIVNDSCSAYYVVVVASDGAALPSPQ